MKGRWFNFTYLLLGLGIILAAVVAFDLGARGRHRQLYSEWPLTDADPLRGQAAIREFGCGACHVIPGVAGATGRVGPKLEDFAEQMYVAGVLSNTPDNLARWIQDPQQVNPGTAMPDLDVSEQDARDIVAYLLTIP
jgi:cytochrome c